ncbi:Glutathione reductase [Granulibacter bethesdensis]|nr:Glutathione reductase [Granulibacter bethesdensis]
MGRDAGKQKEQRMAYDYDLFVIGGGSGGVRCARIAAGHGARVGVAEDRFWGGTCVNVGCVPKKIMVQAAEYGGFVEDSHGFGWNTQRGEHDWAALITAKDREIERLNGAYRRILSSAGADIIDARATLLAPHRLRLTSGDGTAREITAERIVIATGGHPSRPDIPGAELGIVSDDAFHLPSLPRRIAILGGGYIAVEFAGLFRGLGAEVDLIYRQSLPLRGFDGEMRAALADAYAADGIRLHPDSTITTIEKHGGQRVLTLDHGGETLTVDLVFFATGRVPATQGLGLEEAGIETGKDGAIPVDDRWETNVAGHYAIGDVTNRMNLTPVALAEGHMLANRLFSSGHAGQVWNFHQVPTAVFSTPPIATVGMTEEEAEKNGPTEVFTTGFTPMRHQISGRKRRSFMKLLVDQASQKIVGAHMFGEDAPEIMQGLAVAITTGATKQDFDRTIGIHPTAAEEFVTMRSRTRTVG